MLTADIIKFEWTAIMDAEGYQMPDCGNEINDNQLKPLVCTALEDLIQNQRRHTGTLVSLINFDNIAEVSITLKCH